MLGANSRFYIESSVVNLQKDKSKITIGNNSIVRGHLQVFKQGGSIEIGSYCYVGEQSRIWSAEKIKIGDRVLIAHNVNIHDNISHPLDSQLRHRDFVRILNSESVHNIHEFDLRGEEVVVGNDAWIGFNSTILKGVSIGEGAIIGACSLVTTDVPAWTVVAGNPAKEIKKLK
jgi:acetyltransferase-like isoleucine patch superfamily enzyme